MAKKTIVEDGRYDAFAVVGVNAKQKVVFNETMGICETRRFLRKTFNARWTLINNTVRAISSKKQKGLTADGFVESISRGKVVNIPTKFTITLAKNA